MKNLVKDASMGPLREALRQGIEITKLRKEDMRAVTRQVKKSAQSSVYILSCWFDAGNLFFHQIHTHREQTLLMNTIVQDFEYAMQEVRPSVSLTELSTYEEWNRQFGSLLIQPSD